MTDQEPSATEPDQSTSDGQAEFAPPPEKKPRPVAPRDTWWIAGTMALLLMSFFVVEPTLKALLHPPRRAYKVKTDWSLVVQQRAMEATTLAWFFMLGASMGSFLHCMAYRVPRGISVVARGSACPGCGTPIHLWHNVPVFGWLWLRGRCAKCGWEIPARYAITELVFGIVFVVLMVAELMGGGVNLPSWQKEQSFGVLENVWDPDWGLIATYAWHVSLLAFLLTYCLFAWDRFRVPNLLVGLAMLVGFAAPLVWPAIQVVGWDGLTNRFGLDPRLRAAIGSVTGILIGLLLGGCLVRRTPGNIKAGDAPSTILAMVLVGLYLGWQTAIAVAAMSVLVRALFMPTTARSWPVVTSITLATTLHLVAWSWLAELPIYPRLHASVWMTCGLFLVTAIAALLIDSRERGGDAGPGMLAILPTRPAIEAPISVDLPAAADLGLRAGNEEAAPVPSSQEN